MLEGLAFGASVNSMGLPSFGSWRVRKPRRWKACSNQAVLRSISAGTVDTLGMPSTSTHSLKVPRAAVSASSGESAKAA